MLEQTRNEEEIDTNLDGYRKPLRAMGCRIHIMMGSRSLSSTACFAIGARGLPGTPTLVSDWMNRG